MKSCKVSGRSRNDGGGGGIKNHHVVVVTINQYQRTNAYFDLYAIGEFNKSEAFRKLCLSVR